MAQDEMLSENKTSLPLVPRHRSISNETSCNSYEAVMLTLTLPLWTFLISYLTLFFIFYLRKIQSFKLYDKCSPKNAHFRYDFHIITGKYSAKYNKFSSLLILDLLDNQMISTMTVQIPGTTIFNDSQLFVYKHSRLNLRCIRFSIYRRHPIKDVKSIRVAHNCGQTDARIFVYGVHLHDLTNTESRFFPVLSAVRYRGTQWALQTTFEHKDDTDFYRMGAECDDPMGYSHKPTAIDLITILYYIWCASFCFGHLLGVKEIFSSTLLHAVTILFLTGFTAAIISFVYLYFIKSRMIDSQFDSYWPEVFQWLISTIVFATATVFWILSTKQADECWDKAKDWIVSTVSDALILSKIFIVTNFIFIRIQASKQRRLLEETDLIVTKTNSKTQLEFVSEPAEGLSTCCRPTVVESNSVRVQSEQQTKTVKTAPHGGKAPTRSGANKSGQQASGSNRKEANAQRAPEGGAKKEDETLDNAYGKYIKTKNRNSISQYV